MTREITLVVILAFLQVLVIRFSQMIGPQFYWSTGAVFETRSEQTVGALLFRLAIPLSAGAVVVLLIDERQYRVAIASGTVAWFLVFWPILWKPSLMLPFEKRGWILGLILLWWVPFSALPASGVAIARFIGTLSDESKNSGYRDLFFAVAGAALFSAILATVSRLSTKKLRLLGDDELPPSWGPGGQSMGTSDGVPQGVENTIWPGPERSAWLERNQFLLGAVAIGLGLMLRRRD